MIQKNYNVKSKKENKLLTLKDNSLIPLGIKCEGAGVNKT
jgi:hypothetical protein